MLSTPTQPYTVPADDATSLVGVRVDGAPLVWMTGRAWRLSEIRKALECAKRAIADGDRVWTAVELSIAARHRDALMGRRPRPIAGSVR